MTTQTADYTASAVAVVHGAAATAGREPAVERGLVELWRDPALRELVVYVNPGQFGAGNGHTVGEARQIVADLAAVLDHAAARLDGAGAVDTIRAALAS